MIDIARETQDLGPRLPWVTTMHQALDRGRKHRPRIAPGLDILRRLGALIVISLFLVGCASATPGGSSPPSDEALLTDDFSPPNVGWPRFDTDESAVYALADELYLEDRGMGTAVYTPLIGHEYADVLIDVGVRHVQGTVNNWMGVLCRQHDEDNYYLLAISADGYYLILRVINGEATPMVGPEYSTAIRTGKAANALRARCQGPEFALWANGEELVTFQDDSLLEAGRVALFADAVQRGDIVVVAFDDFVLASP